MGWMQPREHRESHRVHWTQASRCAAEMLIYLRGCRSAAAWGGDGRSLALAKLRRCRADSPGAVGARSHVWGRAGLASAIDPPAWLSYSERRAVFWCSPPWPGTVVAAERRLWLVRSARQIQCTC